MKKYNIKTTDVELLKKWYYLMTLGRVPRAAHPAYLHPGLGGDPDDTARPHGRELPQGTGDHQ